MIRVLVVDDHPAFRRGLQLMLGETEHIELVGTAATGQEAIELAASTSPQVILMDLRLPDVDGIEATRRILRAGPGVAVIALTMFEDEASVFAALRAGARGYLLKGADQEEIVRAVQTVAAGSAVFGPQVAPRILDQIAHGADRAGDAFPSLTARERAVLLLIATGEGNATIAAQLGISLKTVRNHVSNIFTKLQVNDRAAAIASARNAGLGGGRATTT